MLCSPYRLSYLTRRLFNTLVGVQSTSISYSKDFTLWPTFLSHEEQYTMLSVALQKLDETEPRQTRRRRNAYKSRFDKPSINKKLSDLFLPDEYYDFEEGHYDGVIHHFREMHLTSWPKDIDHNGLTHTLNRLQTLCPTPNIQTHLLHLASYGKILPHIDNLSASGSWILGVSLGAERTLRIDGSDDSFDVVLPSGSVYLQRDSIRFNYKHSILEENLKDKCTDSRGQRLSIIIRDLPHRTIPNTAINNLS